MKPLIEFQGDIENNTQNEYPFSSILIAQSMNPNKDTDFSQIYITHNFNIQACLCEQMRTFASPSNVFPLIGFRLSVEQTISSIL